MPAAATLIAVILTLAQAPTYWCPMHPNERATAPVACPVCKMTMVPMPPVKVGEYVMDVHLTPHPSGRGASGLSIELFEPDGRTAVKNLDTVHERMLHAFVMDRSLEFFAHVHPERRSDGRLAVELDLPPDEYMVVADFSPAGGAPQTLQRAVMTPGFELAGRVQMPRPAPTARRQTAAGVVVTLSGTLAKGRTSTLSLTFADAQTGEVPRDLEPYLGAPAHLLTSSADLTDVQHAHPEELAAPAASLGSVEFDVTPAREGTYKLWVQFQRAGRVVTVPFVVNVSS